jgi:stearoyl-CoA desaturase (delta-9 desaturase)
LAHGLLNWPLWALIGIWLVTLHLTVVAVSLYLHRDQTHRAVRLHPVVRHFCRGWIWLTTATETREWVAVHRRHHSVVDHEGDPHSPRMFGLRTVLFGGVGLYRRAAGDPETLRIYGQGTPDDWLERRIYAGPGNIVGILLLMGLEVVLFGPLGLTLWAFQMMGIPILAAGVVNGLGHAVGYRNYDTPDLSHNILPWGVVCGGEELHNNHHAFPGSARFSQRYGEFDIGWMYLRVLSFLGLAEIERLAPADPKSVSLQDLVGYRAHLMSRYLKEVLRPTWRNVRRDGFRPSRRSRRLFWLSPKLLSESVADCATLESILDSQPALRTVYEFRVRLWHVWDSGAHTAERLENLREWLRQARTSGVRQLEYFSERVYQLVEQMSIEIVAQPTGG